MKRTVGPFGPLQVYDRYRAGFPHGGQEEKDDDEAGRDEEWERYDRARNFRSRRHEHRRRLHSYLGSHTESPAAGDRPLFDRLQR